MGSIIVPSRVLGVQLSYIRLLRKMTSMKNV